MNGYILECLNVFSENVFNSEDYYFSWAGEAGPTDKTKDIKGVLATYLEPKRCSDAVAKANAMSPKDAELEQAATRYAAALQAIRPLVDEARVYYENRGYKADQFGKARALHQKLVQAFREFDTAHAAISGLINQRQDQEDQRSLAALEKEQGRKFAYLVQATMVHAKAVNRQVQKPWKQLQLAEFSSAFTTYEALVKELVAYGQAHADEVRVSNRETYIQEQEAMLRYSRDFMHRLEDKKPFSGMELRTAENSPNHIMNEYNHLVALYNNMH
jgi:hypothetical protein